MKGKGFLSSMVANEIKELIINNKYKEGDKIPNEMELSEQLDVSRITIREAIKILSATGIVEIKRGVGTFVCDKPGLIGDPLGLTFFDEEEIGEKIKEARYIIEPKVAELAAKNADEDDIRELEKIYLQFLDTFNKYSNNEMTREQASKHYIDYELAFHSQLAKCSKNEVLERIMFIIMEAFIERYWEKKFIPLDLNYNDFHNKIIKAIKERNPEKSRCEIAYHIENAGAWLENIEE